MVCPDRKEIYISRIVNFGNRNLVTILDTPPNRQRPKERRNRQFTKTAGSEFMDQKKAKEDLLDDEPHC